MAHWVGPRGPLTTAAAARWVCFTADLLGGSVEGLGGFTHGDEQLAVNWYGQGESDCLIKTKHCEGLKRC